MIDPNRLNRNHVTGLKYRDSKYYIVVKIVKENNVFVEVEWDRWITMDSKEKKEL